jgi:hypothetical protein
MIQIKKREASETVSPILDTCHISFALPASSPLGTYTIVHLRSVGGRQAWIEEKQSTIDRYKTVVTTVAESTGTYALVRLSSKAQKPKLPAALPVRSR